MRNIHAARIRALLLVLLALPLAGCGYNTIPTLREQANAAWAQVQNQYQRRADLVPNLVETVRGYAKQERETLEAVVNARARATQAQVQLPQGGAPTDPEALRRYQEAQAQLGQALSRLLAVTEAYPDLKSNQNFLALQSQLEGTENRIAVARQRFIKATQEYNTLVRQFPTNLTAMAFGYKPKPQFNVEDEKAIAKPPTVDFGTKK